MRGRCRRGGQGGRAGGGAWGLGFEGGRCEGGVGWSWGREEAGARRLRAWRVREEGYNPVESA